MNEPRPMDALNLAAEYVGAVVVVTASCDRRDANGRRFLSASEGNTQLRRLAVVRPNRDAATRTDQLYSGQVLCMASLEALTINEAAELLVDHESLKRRRQAA